MTNRLDSLHDRLEELLAVVEDLDEEAKESDLKLLDGSDELHRAAAVTHGVEAALRRDLPGFVGVEVEADEAAEPHAPPGETVLQIGGPRR